MIVVIDQFIWRPLLVWSNKFKLEDTEAEFQDTSAVLRFLSRSRFGNQLHGFFTNLIRQPSRRPVVSATAAPAIRRPRAAWVRPVLLGAALAAVGWGVYSLILLLWELRPHDWIAISGALVLTLIRVLCAIALSTLIAVPIGVWIGLNPKLSRFLMPITQIAASFPAPMIFPNLVLLIYFVHGNLAWGSVILMMLGTIWYILFNVISGASAIPQDLRACADLTHLLGWQKWRTLYLPGIFPALTTGWITAAGGAWNASIVSEYVQYNGKTDTTWGLGSLIQDSLNKGDNARLAASVLAMALFVVFFNRAVWKRLSALAQERFQLMN
jgi:NitT/TauT family transport system permease protein